MEQRKLPNVTTSLVLGIISFIACCCSSGLGGLLFSGIALYLARKDEKRYLASPEEWSNYSQLRTAKTVAIIGLVLAILSIIYAVYMIQSYGGWEGYMEYQKQMLEDAGIEIE